MSARWSSARREPWQHMRLSAVQQVAYATPSDLRCAGGPPSRNTRRVVRAIRIRVRARAGGSTGPSDTSGRPHSPADLPHAADDGGRRLGARHPGHRQGQPDEKVYTVVRRRPCRTRPLDRRTAVGSRERRGRQPHPGPSRQGARASSTVTSTRCALRSRHYVPSGPNCPIRIGDSRSVSFRTPAH